LAHKDGSKSGDRRVGTPNRSSVARHEAMAKVNAALNELGEDSLNGMKLLQEVIKSRDCPLDIRIQCSGLLLKHELPLAQERQYVVHMPTELPGDTPQAQTALWWALHSGDETPAGLDPVYDEAVKVILDRAATMKKAETLS
jgi:hypothetical protein